MNLDGFEKLMHSSSPQSWLERAVIHSWSTIHSRPMTCRQPSILLVWLTSGDSKLKTLITFKCAELIILWSLMVRRTRAAVERTHLIIQYLKLLNWLVNIFNTSIFDYHHCRFASESISSASLRTRVTGFSFLVSQCDRSLCSEHSALKH